MTLSKTSALGLLPMLPATAAIAAEHGGVSPKALPLFDFGNGWVISNSMLTGWFVSLAMILVVVALLRRPKILPTKAQAVFEALVEALRDLFEPIVGRRAFPAVFPLLIAFFVFILMQNWMGLLPGVGTVSIGEHGHAVPLIRPFTADFNGTIALALVSFGAFLIIILKYAGPRAIIYDWFGNKADRKETPAVLYFILSVVFLLVGVIEVFSVVIRPFTLSVRLFGNVYGGENLLHGTGYLFVFYFMEMLVGLIQATVFTLLSATYIGMICNHGDGGHEGEHTTH